MHMPPPPPGMARLLTVLCTTSFVIARDTTAIHPLTRVRGLRDGRQEQGTSTTKEAMEDARGSSIRPWEMTIFPSIYFDL